MFPRLQRLLDHPGGNLSGGEQQLLALARCLCGKPKPMLLDKPTEGIQPSICDQPPVVRYPRTPGIQPEDNPLHAWYVRTEIDGQPGGPLSGKRIVLKDNVCLAGVPMMNGAATLRGYVPDQDATVATRILDAGGRIVGKPIANISASLAAAIRAPPALCATRRTPPAAHPRVPPLSWVQARPT